VPGLWARGNLYLWGLSKSRPWDASSINRRLLGPAPQRRFPALTPRFPEENALDASVFTSRNRFSDR